MVSYSTLDDSGLIQLLRQQDKSAYTQIYKRYWAILYRHALRLVKDEAEATDIVQEIFTVLWAKSANINFTTSLSSYLYASVRHRVIDLINRNKIKETYLLSLQDYLKNGECITDELIREKELSAKIDAEIGLLPEKMREVFLLSRKSNLSYKEIASELNISEGTVKKQVYNAIKILRFKFGLFVSLLCLFIHIQNLIDTIRLNDFFNK